ncbi:MAG: KamA family protein [Deltaproteobacteria bacterium]|jgi:lysine 2,3-aminomutase|nr:KamA family protein [Deltaproteobacteria bacterium]MBW2530307.1 KamA family protein [Deltaproteobacteria bacterium]
MYDGATGEGRQQAPKRRTWPLDRIQISVKSHKLLKQLLKENPDLEEIMRNAKNETEALIGVREWVLSELKSRPAAARFYASPHATRELFAALEWRDYAAIRILDYVDNAGREFEDLNLGGQLVVSNPITLLWLGVNQGTGGAKPGFYEDMLELFRQYSGRSQRTRPAREDVERWMLRWPSGLDPRIVRVRAENRDRILNVIIKYMERGEIQSDRFTLDPKLSAEEKFQVALGWWHDPWFHLRFAVRSASLLNEMMGHCLDPDRMRILLDAEAKGMPFFINPYYLSLLMVRVPYFAVGADLPIRDYVLYNRELVDEFGRIVAWEKEDRVQPGKPNAAGWLLPESGEIHRRYPDVAILIPATTGRACAGLCTTCQRMYSYQKGTLGFDLERLEPKSSWGDRLKVLMGYFENDSQLRDILITGGDALMSTDRQLESILDEVFQMAVRKKQANAARPNGEKYAEMVRVRLGSRLLAYLPQRVTPELAEVLGAFRRRAASVGIQQFVIQTHFESPLEVTPEALAAIGRLHAAGWVVTNQHVLTASSSRRGHNAKLRQVLSEVGVLPYYTFSSKGYVENRASFATNERSVQEMVEEKPFGKVAEDQLPRVAALTAPPAEQVENINQLRQDLDLPFVATDRNVLNLPGVGKSLTFRTIGITRSGRRILEFDHDRTRSHSPIIDQLGKVVVIESKPISEYLQQLEEMGEDPWEYDSIWGYSIGVTEPRPPLYEYPEYDFQVASEVTNLDLGQPEPEADLEDRELGE